MLFRGKLEYKLKSWVSVTREITFDISKRWSNLFNLDSPQIQIFAIRSCFIGVSLSYDFSKEFSKQKTKLSNRWSSLPMYTID